jgi:hypothetical protein
MVSVPVSLLSESQPREEATCTRTTAGVRSVIIGLRTLVKVMVFRHITVMQRPGNGRHIRLLEKLRHPMLSVDALLNLYSSSPVRFILLFMVVRYHTPPYRS